MKTINTNLAASLSQGTTTLCQCWIFTRQDKRVFGATDHDQSLTFNGVLCSPQIGLASVQFGSSADLSPDQANLTGILNSDYITDADLEMGVWNGAKVDVFRVDWAAPEDHAHIWSGRLGEVSRNGEPFQAELLSLKVDLERRIGRFYLRKCDAQLGDERCGVDLANAPEDQCDKQFSTCMNVFDNTERFRGFPHLPGTDAIISGPVGNGQDNGGAR